MNVNGNKWVYMKTYEAIFWYKNVYQSVWIYMSNYDGIWKHIIVYYCEMY